ncbi:hypothetical protein DSO57_1030213 [Entomophthora muscae]|uniref:Uncharacterized protein n=1 Tax=Entomophthora muscae TaxID=34485 RepID=A0ACC2TNE4_9FUNG|nr:hypothetical protein DSO57_1030213 [Entomophthora muscae]
MEGLSHNIISGLDWLQHNHPYIDWDTSAIALNRNGVASRFTPIKMSKLLHNTIFFRLTETCSVEAICSETTAAPPLTTTPPPALAALLKEYKDTFSETLDQLCCECCYSPCFNFAFGGLFEDKLLAFAFASQNELMTESGNTIVWFLDPAQLTFPTSAGSK